MPLYQFRLLADIEGVGSAGDLLSYDPANVAAPWLRHQVVNPDPGAVLNAEMRGLVEVIIPPQLHRSGRPASSAQRPRPVPQAASERPPLRLLRESGGR